MNSERKDSGKGGKVKEDSAGLKEAGVLILDKKGFKYLNFVLCLILVIMLAEAIWFTYLLSPHSTLEKADLLVVFPGGQERVGAGFWLTRSGYASNFMIAGSTAKEFNVHTRKYGELPSGVRPLFNGRSATTFEDALNTADTVRKNGFNSVILVTSAYHLPRAYFLLQTFLLRSKVKIQVFGVPYKELKGIHLLGSSMGRKLIFNEMVKFWAGIAEMVSYRITGSLLTEKPMAVFIKIHMKARVLFNVPT